MIVAVLDYIEAAAAHEKTTPPKDLSNYWQIKRYGLPQSGGWLDQPAGLLRRAETAGNLYEAYRQWYVAPSRSEWQARNPEGALMVGVALNLRKYGE